MGKYLGTDDIDAPHTIHFKGQNRNISFPTDRCLLQHESHLYALLKRQCWNDIKTSLSYSFIVFYHNLA